MRDELRQIRRELRALQRVAKEKYPWDDCMRDQMEQYGDEETASKVCGKIKAQSQGLGQYAKKARLLRLAGRGLKAVHAIFPQTMGSDKVAQHLLAELSTLIFDNGLDEYRLVEKIDGVGFVEADSSYDPQDQEEDEEVKGVIGASLAGRLDFDARMMGFLAKVLRVREVQINLTDKRAKEDLCDALTKQIEHEVIPRMESDLDDLFDPIEFVEGFEPFYEVEQVSVSELEIKVTNVSQTTNGLQFHISQRIVGDVTLQPVEEDI